MKEIGAQLFSIWRGIKSLHKVVLVLSTLFVLLALLYVKGKSSHQSHDKLRLAEESRLFDTEANTHKGFELFDTNTWIKGEKELQVLEMRALKGQLEKDLTAFDQIKSASVILDMGLVKAFGGNAHKPKASVILSLNPGGALSSSQLGAITNHLAGAVHGLEPSKIAISDTSGRLYKGLEIEGASELLRTSTLIFEEHLHSKVAALLSTFIDEGDYHCSVQAHVEAGEEQPSSLSLVVAIDQAYDSLSSTIEEQLKVLVAGYKIPSQVAVKAFPFERQNSQHEKPIRRGIGWLGISLAVLLLVTPLVFLYPLLSRCTKKREEETLFKMMTRIDIDRLADSIKGEQPQTIAMMLSYLDPRRAEQLIAALPPGLQEEILNKLSEIEHDNH